MPNFVTTFLYLQALLELEEVLHNFSGSEVEDVMSIIDQFARQVKPTSTSPLYKLVVSIYVMCVRYKINSEDTTNETKCVKLQISL